METLHVLGAHKEGWPAARLLSVLVEHELAERDRRRVERHLAQARLLPGKTLETFDFTTVPMLSTAHVSAITAGDSWIGKGSNVLLFGPPGVGKSHLGSAIGLALIQNGYRVLFTRTTDPAMTLAAVDRLVHHATIFEMNVESYRRKAAEKAKGPGRPPQKASPSDMNAD